MLQWQSMGRMLGLAVVVAILLAACGGDSDTDTVPATPVPTVTPSPELVDIPTWTPVPSPTLPPTLTLAPPNTAAVSEPTFPPPPETGLGELLDGQVMVTILEADLNDSIAETFDATNFAASDGPPVVTFEPGDQLQIETSFTNTFLDEVSDVTLRVTLEVINDQVHLEELQERRAWSGPTPSDHAVWGVIDLVQMSINDAVFDLLRDRPGAGSLTLVDVRQFPDSAQVRARLEAIFAPK